MARRACTFRQQDVTRAIKAVNAAGTKVVRIEIDKAGKIVLIADRFETSLPLPDDDWKA